MKKTTALILAASFIAVCFAGCSSGYKIDDLSQAERIEVRIFSSGSAYTDVVISDKDTIRDISDTFSSLKLKKVRIEKPRDIYCELGFFKGNEQRPFKYISVGWDGRVDTDSALYNITNGINIIDCLSNKFESVPEN